MKPSRHRLKSHANRCGIVPPPSRPGVTLAEVAISALLVGLLVVASLNSVGSTVRTWRLAAEDASGDALAQQLLREIMLQSYEDPNETPVWKHEPSEIPSAATRVEFDDTDDYDDWTASPPQHPNGEPVSGYDGWARSVIVRKLHKDFRPHSDSHRDDGLREIIVTVEDPQGQIATAQAYRSAQGGSSQPIGTDQTVVTWVGCDLVLGAGGPSVSAGTLITNHAESQ